MDKTKKEDPDERSKTCNTCAVTTVANKAGNSFSQLISSTGSLPRVAVEGVVTLADAQTGQTLGSAKLFGHTSSLILGTPRQLANFICRGTAKWVNESRAAGAK